MTSILREGYGPPFVHEGDPVTFNIGVSNNGSEEETFTLDLRDDTEDKLISSKQVTLAAGGANTVSITWDTTGASGGPSPPNPTFPGAVHIITATATLDGDSNESNNSKSFDQPGIYVIAAPKAPEISFPERQEEPEGRTTGELPSAAPSVDTIEESLAEMYVSTVADQQSGASGDPSILTAPSSLSHPYKTAVESDESSAIAKPAIATVSEPLTRISSAATEAKLDEFLSTPGIATTAEALNGVFLYQPEPNAVAAVSGPGVSTSAGDLTQIFAASVDGREDLRLIKSDFDGGIFPPPRIDPEHVEASLESSLGTPGMTTRKSPLFVIPTWPTTNDARGALVVSGFDTKAAALAGVFSTPTQANSLQKVTEALVDTQAVALVDIFSTATGGNSLQQMTKPVADTQAVALADIFFSAAQAGWLQQLTEPLIDTQAVALAETGTIQGRVELQGRTSSLGSYVEVGGQVTFADRQGYFQIQRPAGNFDLIVSAPGYLSHVIHDIRLEPEDILVMPEVTLLFGDADGDGVIDIYDLSVAAGNYGRTASGVWFR